MSLILSPIQCQMARSALRWRLDDLAECSGIHRQMIYRFEAGHRVPIEMKQTLRPAAIHRGRGSLPDHVEL
jgi:transcriptional regulator with XRE-family HTH domain